MLPRGLPSRVECRPSTGGSWRSRQDLASASRRRRGQPCPGAGGHGRRLLRGVRRRATRPTGPSSTTAGSGRPTRGSATSAASTSRSASTTVRSSPMPATSWTSSSRARPWSGVDLSSRRMAAIDPATVAEPDGEAADTAVRGPGAARGRHAGRRWTPATASCGRPGVDPAPAPRGVRGGHLDGGRGRVGSPVGPRGHSGRHRPRGLRRRGLLTRLEPVAAGCFAPPRTPASTCPVG